MTQEISKEREKDINRIVYTSVADAKSSLFHVNDVLLLRDCIAAEQAAGGRMSMINNIKIRIRQLERG